MSNEQWIAESERKDLEHIIAGQSAFIKELKAHIAELGADRDSWKAAAMSATNEAPNHKRVKRALKLADSEYVGQPFQPLWEWAWKEVGDE